MSGTTAATGVRHIIDNLQYPDYIRNHTVFHRLAKITKVFPGIGLPNMSEDCVYSNLIDSKQDAITLLNGEIRNQLNRAGDLTYNTASYSNIFYSLVNEIATYHNSMIMESEGKIVLNFKRDIGMLPDGKFIARNGESVFKVYNKVVEKCKELGHTIMALESLPAFKSFSTSNVPSAKKFKMVFSSSGEEGAWDIATISMRGISSCQSWGSTQSRGLIGSISSKYVGVAYITSGEILTVNSTTGVGKGSKMLRRAMVRFCINKNTKKPALLVDRIYPGDDQAARGVFREFLAKKSNLPVLFPGDAEWAQYYLPVDESQKLATFQPNEFTYMDNKIPYKVTAIPPKDYTLFYNRLAQLDNAIMIKVHNTIVRRLTEYCADKKMHRSEFRGGVANLILSLKKHLSGNSVYYIGYCLPKLYSYTPPVTTNILMPLGQGFDTGKDYERAAIKKAFTHIKQLESSSHDGFKRIGKFMKFYPDSAAKLHKQLMTEYKKELVLVYKDLLRN